MHVILFILFGLVVGVIAPFSYAGTPADGFHF